MKEGVPGFWGREGADGYDVYYAVCNEMGGRQRSGIMPARIPGEMEDLKAGLKQLL
jgi:hypothetical protein